MLLYWIRLGLVAREVEKILGCVDGWMDGWMSFRHISSPLSNNFPSNFPMGFVILILDLSFFLGGMVDGLEWWDVRMDDGEVVVAFCENGFLALGKGLGLSCVDVRGVILVVLYSLFQGELKL